MMYEDICYYLVHDLLWSKLGTVGVSCQIIRILQSMYNKATAEVKVNSSHATGLFKCEKGVRQGCSLSPLLFSLFISSIEVELAENEAGVPLGDITIDTLMFADDIILLSKMCTGITKTDKNS